MGRFDRQAQSRPKHGPPSVSGASKAPAPPPTSRPAWRGSGLTKKAPPRKAQHPAPDGPVPTVQKNILPIELQQLVLNIIKDTFPASQDFDALKPLLGQIKDALLESPYETALRTEEFREGYTIRWSPSRALMYSNVLLDICDEFGDSLWAEQLLREGSDAPSKVLCFGGSAGELMALASVLRYRRADATGKSSAASMLPPSPSSPLPVTLLKLHLVDTVDWSGVVSKLTTGVTTAPQLSKYASAAARARNASFLTPDALTIKCTKTELLDLSLEDLRSVTGSDVTLLTLFFTLNNFYNSSIKRTTAFLRNLSAVVSKGCLLLVIDACEATATAGAATADSGERKAYPINWLLDNALLPPIQVAVEDGPAPEPAWEKLVDDENRLCKLPEKGLNYPAGLENLKVQVHVFRRL